MSSMVTTEQLEAVQAIVAEHGWLTGDEFLELTDNDLELHMAYVAYFESMVFRPLVDKIQSKIDDVF